MDRDLSKPPKEGHIFIDFAIGRFGDRLYIGNENISHRICGTGGESRIRTRFEVSIDVLHSLLAQLPPAGSP